MRFRPSSSRSPLGALAGLFVVGWLCAVPCPAAAEDLGFFEAIKLRSQASEALEEGEAARAATLYARLAAGSTGDQRAKAQFFAAVAEITADAGDLTVARRHLDSLLAERPEHDTAPQARALVRLLGQVDGIRGQVDAAMAQASMVAEEQGDEAAAAAGRVESLAAEIDRLIAELAATRAELAKKNEALEKLKQVVVGAGG